MKIVQISASIELQSQKIAVFGLGEDNLIYFWSHKLGGWVKNMEEHKEPPTKKKRKK